MIKQHLPLAALALILAAGTATAADGAPAASPNTVATRPAPVDGGTQVQQDSVIAATRRFADLLDENLMDEVWQHTGPLMSGKMTQGDFQAAFDAAREPLGDPIDRKIRGFSFSKVLDGVPGEFGVIGLVTDFEYAKGMQEKFVYQMLDGEWKLSGYWIFPPAPAKADSK
jgi:hypothetical protein